MMDIYKLGDLLDEAVTKTLRKCNRFDLWCQKHEPERYVTLFDSHGRNVDTILVHRRWFETEHRFRCRLTHDAYANGRTWRWTTEYVRKGLL